MAAQGCKYILAVDVTTLDDRDLTNYGDSLSGWWLLWNKINVFAAKPIKIPTQADIQLRVKVAAPEDSCMPTIGFHDIQRLNLRIEPSSRRVRFTATNGSRTSAIADFEQLPEPTPQPPESQDF